MICDETVAYLDFLNGRYLISFLDKCLAFPFYKS